MPEVTEFRVVTYRAQAISAEVSVGSPPQTTGCNYHCTLSGPSDANPQSSASGGERREYRLSLQDSIYQCGLDNADSYRPRRWAKLQDGHIRLQVLLRDHDEQEHTLPRTSQAQIIVPMTPSRPVYRGKGYARLKVESGVEGQEVSSISAWMIRANDKSTPQPAYTILVHPSPDLANVLSRVADSTPWIELALAGTHDACAVYGAPFAQCQEPRCSITQQLSDGVRYLDLRMRVIDNELIMYHGLVSQRLPFREVLAAIRDFLAHHPRESVIVAIKEEVPPIHPDFSRLVHAAITDLAVDNLKTAAISQEQQLFFLEPRIPTLGETRGKILLVARFPQGEEWTAKNGDRMIGLHPPWPDNRRDGFEWVGDDDTLWKVQDWYGVPSLLSVPEKADAVIAPLEDSLTPLCSTFPPTRTLTLSYASAASLPFAPPRGVARGIGWPDWGLGIRGVNDRLSLWLLEALAGIEDSARLSETVNGSRIRGIVALDFYKDPDSQCVSSTICELLATMVMLGLTAKTSDWTR